ncbi:MULTISPECIES: hypothetical protein [unclassified Bartonella]|uniref:Uncharacterized protein n=1 Tax=Bartonella rochalimae ATCC BAA-1498 TaxID=685782 RepID=E6YL79_9HYPH|nr:MULTISPECIES: hypothetical protein [unclassified Bartonella]CBI77617.1 hypothetical protein BARRO_30198 [Bartonella rochalimae ATCC BAA-1498]
MQLLRGHLLQYLYAIHHRIPVMVNRASIVCWLDCSRYKKNEVIDLMISLV